MKSTKGLKVGDKLYWYNYFGDRSTEDVQSILNSLEFITAGGVKRNIRGFNGRIKPPEPRLERWMNLYSDGLYPGPYDSEKSADSSADSDRIRCVHFREVRKKKVKK